MCNLPNHGMRIVMKKFKWKQTASILSIGSVCLIGVLASFYKTTYFKEIDPEPKSEISNGHNLDIDVIVKNATAEIERSNILINNKNTEFPSENAKKEQKKHIYEIDKLSKLNNNLNEVSKELSDINLQELELSRARIKWIGAGYKAGKDQNIDSEVRELNEKEVEISKRKSSVIVRLKMDLEKISH